MRVKRRRKGEQERGPCHGCRTFGGEWVLPIFRRCVSLWDALSTRTGAFKPSAPGRRQSSVGSSRRTSTWGSPLVLYPEAQREEAGGREAGGQMQIDSQMKTRGTLRFSPVDGAHP